MPDLVEKFFKEGLTEAEEQALSESIWDSEEMAEKFAGSARAAYVRYGFPEPQLPGGQSSIYGRNRLGFGPWTKGLVILVSLGIGFLYWYFNHSRHATTIAGLPKPAKISSASGGGKDKKVSGSSYLQSQAWTKPSPKQVDDLSTGAKTVRDGNSQKGFGDPAAGSNPSSTGTGGLAALKSAATPINLDQNPSSDYSSISVIVHLSSQTPLEVRVLDTRGIEILPLYNGTIGPGHWVFQWNGQLSNGKQANAGFYLIEVQSGLFVERKTVQIH